MKKQLSFLNRHFRFSDRKTDLRTEVIAGTTTFLAMAYIIFVQPNVLAAAGMDKTALITVTCLVTALATFCMGLFANVPIAMAPGMGLNAFFTYTLVLGQNVPWPTALGIVFLSGVFFLLLTLLGIRRKMAEAIPRSLISATSVGIGLFITFIGLVNLGIVVKNEETLIAAGPMTETVVIGLAGFLVMVLMEIRKIKGSMIAGILAATAAAVLTGKIAWPSSFLSLGFQWPSIVFQLDILGALKWSFMGPIFTLMFMDMFDSIGSLVACTHQAKLVDEKGNIPGLDKMLAVNAGATMGGAVMGTSTVVSYIESVTGIEEGGRTGFSAVVTSLWFLAALLFVPLIGVVPVYATAPALVLVGFFMMKEVRNINFAGMEEGFPAFIIITMIALSYSISTGLAFGFLSFVLFKIIQGKWGDVKPAMWIFAALSLVYFIL